ncbi:TerC family protein [Priestia sp. SB1]|uniref:TerC family protein n=1 Tax=Priestia sp. SB1 TaxID=3132359 RepID=UPI00316C21AB
MDFLIQLLMIIGIDLVLAGDNAVVMALATRNLPEAQRKKAVLWGTVGAVVVRVGLTFLATKLLGIPLLMAFGGVLLVWVAAKLIAGEEEGESNKVINGTMQAIKTIVVADIIMGLDNVLAVAGAAHGSFLLILIGLVVSIPIVVWGSQIISTYMNRFPILVYIGSAIIAYTAAKMIVHDDIVSKYVPSGVSIVFEVLVVAGVVLVGKALKGKKGKHTQVSK